MKTTQQRHSRRIQRVIDHIYGHFADDIDSAAVAEVAQLSAYHWHRIYVAVTGESAVATLRRVRLEKSATALLRDDRPIARIAEECGFENLQAFTRLFSRTYGLPPGKFRASRVNSGPERPLVDTTVSSTDSASSPRSQSREQDSDTALPVMGEQAFNRPVDITERTPLRLVGLWHKGDYHQIGRVFEKVMAAAEIESWPRSEDYTVGVYFDDPDVVSLDSCRSFAGIPVHMGFQVPDGYDTQAVPGGLYATCLHTGPYARLPESYRWLYREWLRGSAHDARDNPCHEIYLNSPYNTSPTALETLICLPLDGSQDHDGKS